MSDRLRDDYLAARLAFLTDRGREPRRGLDDADAGEFSLLIEPVEQPVADPPAIKRLEFSRSHVWVLAAICIIGLVIMVVFVARGRPTESVPAEPVIEAASTSSPTPPTTIRVHVVGAVRSPGVVELRQGDRVADAVAAAGGLSADAAPGELNLAAPVPDGAQIVIGVASHPTGEVRAPTAMAAGSVGSGESTMVNLNQADATSLQALPGVGPVTASRIVEWRTSHGKFSSIEELQEVPGIGPKIFAQLQPLVTV